MKNNLNILFIANNVKTQWDIIEECFKLPPEERTAFMIKQAKENKTTFLGCTDKNVHELSVECIQKGIKAKGFGKGK